MADRLSDYRRKRDPTATREPFPGSLERSSSERMFVVQRHDARRLHYDFRLERDGTLVSWAVPKGVPLEPGQQHLAVHVEDHPLEYADFEGEIPAGSYGAGTVEIWDRGTYELVEEKRDGGLTVRLHGERLQGTWALVPARLSGDPRNWLILRKREDGPPLPAAREYVPMLATPSQRIPAGEGWRFEPKWDGYRALGYVRNGEARLRSRNGNDLSDRFPAVVGELVKAVRSPNCVVDGEVCALDERGRPSFSSMQQGLPGTTVVYELFDLLELDGEPVVDLPLCERRQRLEALLAPNRTVQLSGVFDDGEALLEAAEELGLEGVMAKRSASAYREGKRGGDWLKVKRHGRQEFVICGWTKGHGRREGRLGSLVLGTFRGDELSWAGNCGTGFSERDIDELVERLEPLRREESPFAAAPRMPKVRKGNVTWVEPRLVCEVEFAEWTHDGISARRSSRGCATTSRRGRCGGRPRSRWRKGRYVCPISTRSSGRTRGSRKAT